MRLSEVPTGQEVVIVKVLGYGAFCKRIIEMGFVRGKKVKVLLNAPLKDPVKYKILDYEVSLRRSEAALIEVMTLEEARTELPVEAGELVVDEEMQMHARFGRGQALLCAGQNRIGVEIIASRREHDLITTDPRDIERIREQREMERIRRQQAAWAAQMEDTDQEDFDDEEYVEEEYDE